MECGCSFWSWVCAVSCRPFCCSQPKGAQNNRLLFGALFLTCTGIVVNRFVFTIQTLAIPVLPFEKVVVYLPTWAEWAPTLALVAYGALILSLSYRYLPVFPQEKELNPIQ